MHRGLLLARRSVRQAADVEIRTAGTADVGILAELLLQFAEGDGTPGDRKRFATDLLGWWQVHRDSHVAFLAVLPPGEPVGMVWLALAARVPRPGSTGRLGGDVQSLYVAPEHRSTGVGSALVESVLRHAESLGLEHVTVHSNEQAQSLYGRAGFRASGDRLVWTPADRR